MFILLFDNNLLLVYNSIVIFLLFIQFKYNFFIFTQVQDFLPLFLSLLAFFPQLQPVKIDKEVQEKEDI